MSVHRAQSWPYIKTAEFNWFKSHLTYFLVPRKTRVRTALVCDMKKATLSGAVVNKSCMANFRPPARATLGNFFHDLWGLISILGHLVLI